MASGSPTTFNNLFLGEQCDARLEVDYGDWSTANYKGDTQMSKSVVLADASGIGRLEAQATPPIRRQQTLSSAVLSAKSNANGRTTLVVDTGVKFAGTCRIRVNQHSTDQVGAQTRLMHGELLTREGQVTGLTSVVSQIKSKNSDAPCQPEITYQQDILTLGPEPVDWTPIWSWHEFWHTEVTPPPMVAQEAFSVKCFRLRTDVDVSIRRGWMSKGVRFNRQ